MFVAHDIVLDVCFVTARARLLHLIGASGLAGASEAAYREGQASIVRIGPFGDRPIASKLVGVRLLQPVDRDDGTTTALRWEAAGVTGDLFPMLDADIALSPAGPAMTRLALAGIYRPLPGCLGAVIDDAVSRRVSEATVRALLTCIADSLTGRARAADPDTCCDRRLLPGPATEPDVS